MRFFKVFCLLWIIALTVLSQPVCAQGNTLSSQKVNTAISQCVSYLQSMQIKGAERRGAWPGYDMYGCGQTCLVTLALLSGGRTPKSPEIEKALSYIRSVKPQRTYEAALKTMALCAAEPLKDKAQIEQLVDWLESNQSANGGWGYGEGVNRGDSDESNSQFAVLALWEASKLGIEVSPDCLEKAKRYWVESRKGDGWGYRNETVIGSMTCAGIASTLILQDSDSSADASVNGGQIQCCGGRQVADIDRALNWLANNFQVAANPGNVNYKMYYLYALERVGRLTGQRFIGSHDWYREGADHLISQQLPAGGIIPGGGGEPDQITSTAMALLFLAKGKRQVVIGHLQHGIDSDWNRHRRSTQHLTGHIELVWKRELAWQSVRIDRANLPDLLETPVLIISGAKEFSLSPAQRKLLKDYTEQSGFIFAEACHGDGCDGAAFDRSFRKEMEIIFDKPLHKLPPSHPIWSVESKVDPSGMPKDFWLYGLESCCRTSVVYSPISLSCRWELARPWGASKKRAPNVEKDIENAVKIGVNVVSYATGREVKEKLDAAMIVMPQSNRQQLSRGSLVLPKIMHTGGADDTPKAISNLLEVYRSELHTPAETKTPLVSLASEEIENYPILYIHGRNRFSLSENDKRGLKKHFENGGFVLGDAICASKEFGDSVRREFLAALPDAEWRTLDPRHPFMQPSSSFRRDLSDVVLIDPSTGGNDLKQSSRRGPAEIQALEWNGRIVMLFSPNDLSCAMESKHSMQCRGYIREDAFWIGIKMLLYAISE